MKKLLSIGNFTCHDNFPLPDVQVEKSLLEMQRFFAFNLLLAAGFCGLVSLIFPFEAFTVLMFVIVFAYALIYGAAFWGLKDRTQRGYKFTFIACKALFFARGYHERSRCYLRTLDRPEVKKVFVN